MDIRRIFRATLGSIIADFSSVSTKLETRDSRRFCLSLKSPAWSEPRISSFSMDEFIGERAFLSMLGHLEPLRMYRLLLLLDCRPRSPATGTCDLEGASNSNLQEVQNETARFGASFERGAVPLFFILLMVIVSRLM